jgi:hypothetical protein
MRAFCVGTILTAAVLIAPLAQAQGPGRGAGRGFGGGGGALLLTQKSVQEELKLSEEQVKQVDELAAKQRELFSGARDLGREERQKRFTESRDASQKAVSEILNAEQQKRYKQIGLQLRGLSALDDPEVASSLGLSDEQKKKVEEIQTAAREEMRSAFQDGGGDREKFRAAREATNEKLQGVLTAEQKTTWQELTGEPFKGQLQGPQRGGDGQRRRRSQEGADARSTTTNVLTADKSDESKLDARADKGDAQKKKADKGDAKATKKAHKRHHAHSRKHHGQQAGKRHGKRPHHKHAAHGHRGHHSNFIAHRHHRSRSHRAEGRGSRPDFARHGHTIPGFGEFPFAGNRHHGFHPWRHHGPWSREFARRGHHGPHHGFAHHGRRFGGPGHRHGHHFAGPQFSSHGRGRHPGDAHRGDGPHVHHVAERARREGPREGHAWRHGQRHPAHFASFHRNRDAGGEKTAHGEVHKHSGHKHHHGKHKQSKHRDSDRGDRGRGGAEGKSEHKPADKD